MAECVFLKENITRSHINWGVGQRTHERERKKSKQETVTGN